MTASGSGPLTSRRVRVVLSEAIHEQAIQRLRSRAEVVLAPSTTDEDLIEACRGADALIVRSTRVGARLIRSCPSLRVIGRHGVGTENIEVEEAARAGITVVATPGANAHSVAEFVLLATMLLARQVPSAVTALRTGGLSGAGSLPGAVVRAGLVGSTLAERSVGIVGMGAIGRQVARMAQGLGAEVVGHDPYLVGPAPVEMVTLEQLSQRCDVITLHVPATPATAALVDEALLDRVRVGTLLINTARAEVVDPAAVIAALDTGRLAGYAVDTYLPEPPDLAEPLLHHPRVLATPHMAAMTTHALLRMGTGVVDAVLAELEVPGGSDPTEPIEPTEPVRRDA